MYDMYIVCWQDLPSDTVHETAPLTRAEAEELVGLIMSDDSPPDAVWIAVADRDRGGW